MARFPRSMTVRPGFEVHATWRGHNREANISEPVDKNFYLQCLVAESEKDVHGNTLNALVLMSNHVHEMYRIANQEAFSDYMRRHHAKYGRFFNRRHRRSGQVAEGRPKTSLIQSDEYSMNAVFYIHANPVRAKLVKDAGAYPWSTHALYAFGHRAPWMKGVQFPRWYLALGTTSAERQARYRKLFGLYLKKEKRNEKTFNADSIFWGDATWTSQQQDCLRAWLRERTHANSMAAREGPPLIN